MIPTFKLPSGHGYVTIPCEQTDHIRIQSFKLVTSRTLCSQHELHPATCYQLTTLEIVPNQTEIIDQKPPEANFTTHRAPTHYLLDALCPLGI